MFGKIDLLTKASAMARHAATRHGYISENLANADTPNYKARDIAKFNPEAVKRAMEGDKVDLNMMMRPTVTKGLEASPNGNTVSLEDQLGRAADAKAQHETALAVYKKAMDLLRLSYKAPR
ncbi:MAG: hypothetical protein MRY74_17075 [Neomegalonema sp.]|nr:hypothetical protein [Neomegalonema sp.]